MTELTALRDSLVEWVFDQAGGSQTKIIDVAPFLEEAGLSLTDGKQLVRDCIAVGLLEHGVQSLGAARGRLTAAGVEAVLARKRRRTDKAERRKVARIQLVRWFYDRAEEQTMRMQVPVHDFLTDDLSTFEGTAFSSAEIQKASLWLCSKKLLEGTFVEEFDGPTHAAITVDGEECIERFGGDVGRYLEHRDSHGPTLITNTFGNVTATNVAIGSTNVTMNVANNADLDAVGSFVTMMLRDLNALQLSPDLERGARSALAEADKELAGASPNRNRVAAALDKFTGYVMEAGKPVVTAIFMMAAQAQGMIPTPGQ